MAEADDAEPVYLSRDEAAQVFNVSLPTIDRWIREAGDRDGHAFVVEFGGNGRPYRIDATKIRSWREGRVAGEQEEERRRKEMLAQLEMDLLGGEVAPGEAGGNALTVDQRTKLWNEQIILNKLRREREELVERSRAEAAAERRLKFLADFFKGLPDILARRLGWDAAVTAECAAQVEVVQERLARMLIDGDHLDD